MAESKDTTDKDLQPTQQAERREDAQGVFDEAVEVGHQTAAENLKAEADENSDSKPGAENITAKVTTSEAQTELRDESDPADVKAKKVDARAGDDKEAQKTGYGVKVGQETAKENLKAEEQPEGTEDGTTYEDAIEAGRKTAEKNAKAEASANKAANKR